jgi:hypothetical protein
LQSPALTEVDTPANTERPNKAVIILLMIILLQGVALQEEEEQYRTEATT